MLRVRTLVETEIEVPKLRPRYSPCPGHWRDCKVWYDIDSEGRPIVNSRLGLRTRSEFFLPLPYQATTKHQPSRISPTNQVSTLQTPSKLANLAKFPSRERS